MPDTRGRHPQTMGALRVVVVDDHELFRDGLRSLLDPDQAELVGECGTLREAVPLAIRERPDVVVLDLGLPDGSGLDVIAGIKAAVPSCGVLVLSGSSAASDVLDAVDAGADGYIIKDADFDAVLRGIRTVAEGGGVFSPRSAAVLAYELRRRRRGER